MKDLPDNLSQDLPANIRREYRIALRSLLKKYTKRDISKFLECLRDYNRRFIAANGLAVFPAGDDDAVDGARKKVVSVPAPNIPHEALTETQMLCQALDDCDEVNSDGISSYLSKQAASRLRREDSEPSRRKANRTRKEQSEVWQSVVREAAQNEWKNSPNASYESIGLIVYHDHPELCKDGTKASTVITFLKTEKLKPPK